MSAEGRSKHKQICAKALEQFTKVDKLYHDHFYNLGALYFCQKVSDKAEAGDAGKRMAAEETVAD